MSEQSTSPERSLAANDQRLVGEAIERLRATESGQYINIEAIRSVLVAELKRGRRDMFSLVRAGQRALRQ